MPVSRQQGAGCRLQAAVSHVILSLSKDPKRISTYVNQLSLRGGTTKQSILMDFGLRRNDNDYGTTTTKSWDWCAGF